RLEYLLSVETEDQKPCCLSSSPSSGVSIIPQAHSSWLIAASRKSVTTALAHLTSALPLPSWAGMFAGSCLRQAFFQSLGSFDASSARAEEDAKPTRTVATISQTQVFTTCLFCLRWDRGRAAWKKCGRAGSGQDRSHCAPGGQCRSILPRHSRFP